MSTTVGETRLTGQSGSFSGLASAIATNDQTAKSVAENDQ